MSTASAIDSPAQMGLYADLPDHASEPDSRAIPIDRVGITRLRYPIQVKTKENGLQSTVADVEMAVGLPAEAKGTHMSRFIEILNEYRGEMTVSVLPDLLNAVRRRLGAPTASIALDFSYFLEKEAPVSRARSLMEYRCGFRARHDGRGLRFRLVVVVPVKSLCPCSKAVSDYGAHNQRSEIRVEFEADDFVWIEDLIAAVEGCASSPLYALLKREDEKYVTERAYDNPRFVEDLVREVLLAVRGLGEARAVSVAAENFESIHNHSAFAELRWEREGEEGARQLELSLPEGGGTFASFGAWVRSLREQRGLSLTDLAARSECSVSFLSRLERGEKGPGEGSLEKLADALGQDTLKFRLRAGSIPEELLYRVRKDPESFLRWASAGG